MKRKLEASSSTTSDSSSSPSSIPRIQRIIDERSYASRADTTHICYLVRLHRDESEAASAAASKRLSEPQTDASVLQELNLDYEWILDHELASCENATHLLQQWNQQRQLSFVATSVEIEDVTEEEKMSPSGGVELMGDDEAHHDLVHNQPQPQVEEPDSTPLVVEIDEEQHSHP